MIPIFIISQHRTGSTLLKNMLDANPAISMAFDEMNIYEPLRKNSLDLMLEKEIKSIPDLITAIEQKSIFGTFWKSFEKSGIPTEKLADELEKYPSLNVQNILEATLKCLSEVNETSFSGVKYAVHLKETPRLKEWFPKGKMIFLTRNPKAMIASKLNDKATTERKKKSIVHRIGIHYFTLLYFCLDFKRSAKVYKENKDVLELVTYEKLVHDNEGVLKNVCDFCNVPFDEKMLMANGKESSYKENNYVKPEIDSIDKYKRILSKFDQWLIDFLTRRSQNQLLS